jgi:rhodanese-related sulfurtransferase
MQPPQIDSQELSRKLNEQKKPVVLDVREVKEVQDEGLIAGSLHIPMTELQARVGEVPRTGEIVAVCKRGQRSWNVAQWLRQQGYDASSLAGGLDAWRAAGLPVAR